MTFDPPERKAEGGSKVIRRLLRGRREKPGDEAGNVHTLSKLSCQLMRCTIRNVVEMNLKLIGEVVYYNTLQIYHKTLYSN